MGVTVRYSNLIHPQLVESVRTHQNSTFKLVKLGKGKLLLNVYLLLNCIISSLSEWFYIWNKWCLPAPEWATTKDYSGETESVCIISFEKP